MMMMKTMMMMMVIMIMMTTMMTMMMKRALTGLSLFTETGYYLLVLPDPEDVQFLETFFFAKKWNIFQASSFYN